MTSEFALASRARQRLFAANASAIRVGDGLARGEMNKLSFHRNPTLEFSLPSAATTQRIVMSPVTDSRLHPDSWRSDTLLPHRARAVRKSRRLGRYNSPVA